MFSTRMHRRSTATHVTTLPSVFLLNVNTTLINTPWLSSMLLVMLFVFPAERHARLRFLDWLLLAVISDLHIASGIGILSSQVAFIKA